MRMVLPLIQMLIVALLYLSLRGWAQTLPVVLSLPCAALGSVRLLALLDYNLPTATWAGLIALEGVADVATARVEGTAKCLRPVPMTAATPCRAGCRCSGSPVSVPIFRRARRRRWSATWGPVCSRPCRCCRPSTPSGGIGGYGRVG